MDTKTTDTVTYDASAALSLANQAKKTLASASDFVIDSHIMYELASDDLKHVKRLQKEVEEHRTGITGPLNDALRAVNALFAAPKDYLAQAEITLKRSMVAYMTEQDRLIAIEREKAAEESRKERERLAKIEAEKMAQAQAAQREAQEAAAKGDKEAADKAQAAAEQAELEAQSLQMEQQVVTATPAVVESQKVSGISGRVTYSAQVDDLLELVKAVAAGVAPIQCISADIKFLGAQARAFKKTGALYPGVQAIAERGIAARAA